MIVIFIFFVKIAAVAADPASEQLCNYRDRTWGRNMILKNSNGAPIEISETSTLNRDMFNNPFFLETMSHFAQERIPPRVVHAKGTGAFGYFEVTHDVTNICKASLFNRIGKRTPVAVRFSLSTKDKGEADTVRDVKGFSTKFYTEDGNFDIVGFSSPIFFFKDPILFPSLINAVVRNPVTNLHDFKMFWDFLTLEPETMFFLMHLFRDYGTNDGYRHMAGYSIHTYQLYNDNGESFYARFHFVPDAGVKNLPADEAANISGSDPDYANRDLYNAIEKGDFPSWSVSLQVLSTEDVQKAKFDVFDVTKVLPVEKYPLTPLGKLVLDTNPMNIFSDIEQIAFGPANLVPGILGSPDKVFETRLLAYRHAQSYRLGINFNKIPTNCPLRTVFSYDRDGKPPVGNNGGDAPNYFPNSYNGPIPYYDPKRPELLKIKPRKSHNFDQAADMYSNEMTQDERHSMITNIVGSLSQAEKHVQRRAVGLFTQIHPDLGSKISTALNKAKPNCEI